MLELVLVLDSCRFHRLLSGAASGILRPAPGDIFAVVAHSDAGRRDPLRPAGRYGQLRYTRDVANLITLSRLLLLIVVVAIAYQPDHPWWQLANVLLLIFVFVTDGLDGWVARRRGETSVFGAMFDIAGDRIVELSMWVVLADLDLVPVWVPLVFVIRGTIVDTIRANQVVTEGKSPFSMIRSPVGQWLVAGRFMRGFYAVLKATAFSWLLLLQPLPVLVPEIWHDWAGVLTSVGTLLVYLTVLICVLRGLPVVIEFVYEERDSLIPRSAGEDGSR